jgi:hypothetical protein
MISPFPIKFIRGVGLLGLFFGFCGFCIGLFLSWVFFWGFGWATYVYFEALCAFLVYLEAHCAFSIYTDEC